MLLWKKKKKDLLICFEVEAVNYQGQRLVRLDFERWFFCEKKPFSLGASKSSIFSKPIQTFWIHSTYEIFGNFSLYFTLI